MFITTPNQLNNILNNYEAGSVEPEQAELLSSMHRKAALLFLENKNAVPTQEDFLEAAEYILDTTGVMLNIEEIESIFSLFPFARIKLALEGVDDTEVRGLIYDVACNFFVGCEAPLLKDDIDMDRFIRYLQLQAKAMGYRVHELV